MSSKLWQRLRVARGAAGLKQQDIADATGVSRVAVGHWESPDPHRRTRPSIESLQKFASITGAPLDWLIDDNSALEAHWGLPPDPERLPGDLVEVPVLEGDVKCVVEKMRENPDMAAAEAAKSCVGCAHVASVYISNNMSQHYMGRNHSPRMIMLRMRDHAMDPEIREGDGVVFDVDEPILHNDIVMGEVTDTPSGYSARRIRASAAEDGTITFHAEPDNDDYLTYHTKPVVYQDYDFDLNKALHASLVPEIGANHVWGKIIQLRRVYF